MANLWLVLRQSIKNQIDNPISGDYSDFNRVWSLWKVNKDRPVPDHSWTEAGYPLPQPKTEDWGL